MECLVTLLLSSVEKLKMTSVFDNELIEWHLKSYCINLME